ncbi:MAG: DUF1801 domain-containing protein [Saccharospirillaceae bacterium]|nr:DUF1801 domain-containing protein [Pseudomonadales bacterium]NRB77438.1 DUF1801 domain-containing protein [Saccharospirillaceae bacterium]
MTVINDFISSLGNATRSSDAKILLSIMQEQSGYQAHLTGSIIGFGQYHYKYDSGLEGDASVVAFSPRKQKLVLYIMSGFANYEKLLQSLGKYKTGKSCLYINKLKDVDINVLSELIKLSVKEMQNKYVCK